MENSGVVKSTEDEYALVSFVRESSCGGNCSQCNMCSTKEHIVTVKNPIGAKNGDVVIVETPSGRIYLAAFLVYIFPMFLSLAVGMALWSNGAGALISSIVGVGLFALAYIILCRCNNLQRKSQYFMGHITAVTYRHQSENVVK
ncbi:MAG: SoxR reducing system RseC family protein [Eubacteriales bacterium]|nr:SoxR reducing system RseC family protein [Eubacteriales bacterium]